MVFLASPPPAVAGLFGDVMSGPPFEYQVPPPKKSVYESHRCTDHEWSLYRFTQSDGRLIHKEYCSKCGSAGKQPKQATLTKVVLDSAMDRPDTWPLRELWKQASERIDDSWQEWYAGYLESPVWEAKRMAVFRRSGGKCESCGWATSAEVHHLTYANVGREPLFDLVAVCEACHRRIHGREA